MQQKNLKVWRVSSSGILCLVVRWVSASKLLAWWCLVEFISSTLKMEAICSSETSADTQRTTRHHIPEDNTLHNHLCENLQSWNLSACFKYHKATGCRGRVWSTSAFYSGTPGSYLCSQTDYSKRALRCFLQTLKTKPVHYLKLT
jgi:hypothetical protein